MCSRVQQIGRSAKEKVFGSGFRLCHDCHTGTDGAQYDSEKNLYLKQVAQMAYEQTHTREQWMLLMRKNYL